MENSLALLDGKMLLVGLIGIIIGWLIRWLVARQATNQLLAQNQSEVEAKSANIDALKHDLTLRERTISEQKESIAALTKERSGQVERVVSQENDINDLTAKLDLLESSQSENGDAIAVLEDTVAGLEEQISSERELLENLRGKHSKEIRDLESSRATLTEQLKNAQKSTNELSLELAATKETADKLRQELAVKNGALEKRAAPINQLKDALTQITQLRQNDLGELSSLQSSLAVWQARAEKAENSLAQSKNTPRDNETSKDTIASARSYEKLLSLKDQEISAQQKQTQQAQAKLLSVRETIGERENEIRLLTEQLHKLNADGQRRLDSMERKLKEHQSSSAQTIEELTKQREFLQEKIDNLTTENASSLRRLATANENLDELDQGNKSLRKALNEDAEKQRTQRDEINALISTTESLESQLARASAERETVKRNLDYMQRELQAKNHAIADLNSSLAKNEAVCQQLESALERCETKLQEKPPQTNTEGQPPTLHLSRPAQVDDLKKIKGVGPALEGLLNDLGIYQFSQLASLTSSEVAWVDEHIESFKGRIYRERWVKQAKKLITD